MSQCPLRKVCRHSILIIRPCYEALHTPSITVRSFPMLFLVFTAFLVHVNSAAIGVNQPNSAAGGVRGRPGQAGYNDPKKNGPEAPNASTSELTISTFPTANGLAQHSSATTSTLQIFTSSIPIFPTLSSTSGVVSMLSSSSGSRELMLIITTTPTPSPSILSSLASVFHSSLTASSAANTSSTTSSSSLIVTTALSEWPTIPTTTTPSMPSNVTMASTNQLSGRRNLTIILTTVLLPTVFALTVSILLLTRCCTRKPYLPTLHLPLRTKPLLLIPDEETTPLGLEKPQRTTEREPQNASATTATADLSTPSTKHLSAPPLPLFSPTRFSPLSLSPLRRHPPQLILTAPLPLPSIQSPPPLPPPKHNLHQQRPHLSSGMSSPFTHKSSSGSSGSKSARSSGLLSEKGNTNTALAPARFTFGVDVCGEEAREWVWGGSEGEESRERRGTESDVGEV